MLSSGIGSACAEGAIEIVDGKAKLISETYCDGLGACLGECPRDAIIMEERPAPEFDEEAVKQHLQAGQARKRPCPAHACPGSALRSFAPTSQADAPHGEQASALSHWPVQLLLVPPMAPFLQGADILICADCVPFALPDFHSRFLRGRAVLVGCPKLDDIEYYEQKLAEVFAAAGPKSITVLRMEVPCCGALARAVAEARDRSAPGLPVEVHTIGVRGADRCQMVEGRPVDAERER